MYDQYTTYGCNVFMTHSILIAFFVYNLFKPGVSQFIQIYNNNFNYYFVINNTANSSSANSSTLFLQCIALFTQIKHTNLITIFHIIPCMHSYRTSLFE